MSASGAADFDAIVVGSGPGGSTAADVLTAAGWSVCIFEKGRNHLIDLDDPTRLKQDFSNDEIKFTLRHFLGPDPFLEPRTFRRRQEDGERGQVGEMNNVPSTVGGGGPHADGKLPRFREDDFRTVTEYGPMPDCELADWPIDYAEMEPYYAEAERAIGVSGDAEANPLAAWRSGPYPMPPGPDMYGATLTVAAAQRLGYHPYAAPTGVNTTEYDGRPACVNCGFCAFYGCPIHAKGDPVSMLQKALLTGRCVLRPETFVAKVNVVNGRATGVDYIGPDGERRTENARVVILAAGAIETPRLMLLSGFEHPLIGRNVMFHFQTFVMGSFEERLHPHRGRAVTHLHDDPIVIDDRSRRAAGDAGLPWIRGGLVEHAGPATPIIEAMTSPWGPMHKEAMRRSALREHMWGFCMQGEDMPQLSNRVDLDPSIRDVRGFPVSRTTYFPHRHELAASAHHAERLAEIHKEAGGQWSFPVTSPSVDAPYGEVGVAVSPVPFSHHVMGTARMGDDPATSVVDRWQRMHDVPNVVVCDSSPFVTSTGFGPTLTLAALSLRAAKHLAEA
jgi:choline dehydrogenase-like flavoprotein